MSTKCASCGVETTLDASFFKGRKSFSRLVKTYCPTCWLQRQHSTVKWVFLSNLGVGAVGLLFWLAWPELGVGRVFINLLFFHIFMMLTILPHELGHAWMARWLGMRVFKIYLGSGTTVFTFSPANASTPRPMKRSIDAAVPLVRISVALRSVAAEQSSEAAMMSVTMMRLRNRTDAHSLVGIVALRRFAPRAAAQRICGRDDCS